MSSPPHQTGHPVIRTFTEADRAAVVLLWSEAFPHDPPHNVSDRMIDVKLRVQPELFLVACIEDSVVGSVMAGFDGVRGWLHRLAVSSAAKRRGVGTALVRAAESALLEMGCRKVNLQVRESNLAVVEFYRSLGYAVEGNVSLGRQLHRPV